MRIILALWAAPLLAFWGWFGLSYYDMNFGYVLLTREAHELIFQLYGEILGIDPVTIPSLVAKACVFDTFILLGIWAFRRRRNLRAWLARNEVRSRFALRRARYSGEPVPGSTPSR
ncbi:hypothetical protein KEU06_22430 [Pseudaminobacter sp. 19-2017]|uniref:Uncharacterized protein n=1 Tax=Pseudaminobacter soli (ex Zhang et al. 2022) TaxID=2831468 RepID=A0A942E0Y7_9HYPH|nr:DUF6105 family protein [Pseudaminobacter soli]MBS3651376.1 hypothetical protein [Pseudaminobacter soli]